MTEDTINFSKQPETFSLRSIEYWSASNALRWAVPPDTTTDNPRLQQAWTSNHGGVDWRDVPTAIVEK